MIKESYNKEFTNEIKAKYYSSLRKTKFVAHDKSVIVFGSDKFEVIKKPNFSH